MLTYLVSKESRRSVGEAMNREEEMLLQLLMKKYKVETTSPTSPTLSKPIRHKKKVNRRFHQWSDMEKDFLWVQSQRGESLDAIAHALGMRKNMVSSMLYNIKHDVFKTYTPPSVA